MKQEIISKTIVTVLSTAVVASFCWLWTYLQPFFARNLPPAVTSTLSWCWQGVCSAASWLFGPVSIPAWLFLALATTTMVVLVRHTRSWIARWRQRTHAHITPIFHAFTEFRRFGLVWRWEWKGQRIACVCAFCPQCDRRIRYDEDAASSSARPTILFCSNCDSIQVERPGKYPQIISDVTLEIEHAVRTGEWRQHVRKSAESPKTGAAPLKRKAS